MFVSQNKLAYIFYIYSILWATELHAGPLLLMDYRTPCRPTTAYGLQNSMQVFELTEMAKKMKFFTFLAQPAWVWVISSSILYVNVVLEKFQW